MTINSPLGKYDSETGYPVTDMGNDIVNDKTIDKKSFVPSGIEIAYNNLYLKAHQLIRGIEFMDVMDIYNGGKITVAYGGYIELGGV